MIKNNRKFYNMIYFLLLVVGARAIWQERNVSYFEEEFIRC